ncbi:MAG TPA: hypothetical protein VM240_14020 [Verrucomicrobiae bacterium]|nr:hypothetical protein [Verrucomicrobiae bacterium]
MGLGKLKRAWRRRQQQRLDRPLPSATPAELEQIALLRKQVAAFPLQVAPGQPPSEAEWRGNLDALRRDVLEQDPREFTRFPVVLKTMFVDDAPYLSQEIRFLRDHRDYSRRWAVALQECGAGHPLPYGGYPATSGNLLHHCYHLARFGDATGVDVAQLPFVLEFGGGYGSLCRVFHRCGFRGRYVIFDFSHFSALQRYFLRSVGIVVHEDAAAFRAATTGVICVSTLEALDDVLPLDTREAMFTATWSLSEAPAALREAFLPRVRAMRAFLIGFQDRFNEMDNQAWFGSEWPAALPHVKWQSLPIAHLRGNNYLFGVS